MDFIHEPPVFSILGLRAAAVGREPPRRLAAVSTGTLTARLARLAREQRLAQARLTTIAQLQMTPASQNSNATAARSWAYNS